jgi:CheY-like chemotaxis protein
MNETIRVLLVDDEKRFLLTTSEILEKRGFNVEPASNGPEAIEKVKTMDLDVVVLDLKMPGMDGSETFGEIRKISADLPVIMLTGHGTPDSALAGLRGGIFDYLVKPCPIEILSKKIHDAHVGRGGLSKEEPRVRDIMTPLSSFSSMSVDGTLAGAVYEILESFTRIMTTSSVHENVHRSILIFDEKKERVIGIVTFTDILKALQPPYMRVLTESPPMADAYVLESSNYSGMFTIMTRDLARKKVRDIMSDAPPFIAANANLMEAATRMLNRGLRRLLVKEGDSVVGVLREQDLFFEIAGVIKKYNTLR